MMENYSVVVESFAQRHYIKKFEKKYHRAWDITLRALVAQFERIDMLLKKDVAETIVDGRRYKILKTQFSVAGTGKSPKSSGNRCIVAIEESRRTVYVLLVYHKNDLSDGNETAQWKKIVKDHYPEYRDML